MWDFLNHPTWWIIFFHQQHLSFWKFGQGKRTLSDYVRIHYIHCRWGLTMSHSHTYTHGSRGIYISSGTFHAHQMNFVDQIPQGEVFLSSCSIGCYLRITRMGFITIAWDSSPFNYHKIARSSQACKICIHPLHPDPKLGRGVAGGRSNGAAKCWGCWGSTALNLLQSIFHMTKKLVIPYFSEQRWQSFLVEVILKSHLFGGSWCNIKEWKEWKVSDVSWFVLGSQQAGTSRKDMMSFFFKLPREKKMHEISLTGYVTGWVGAWGPFEFFGAVWGTKPQGCFFFPLNESWNCDEQIS